MKLSKKKIGKIVKVSLKINKRIQIFEGILKSVKNRGINSSFKMKRNKFGEIIILSFKTYSPNILSIITS